MWAADELSCQRFKARTIAIRLGSIASNLNTLNRYIEAEQTSTGVLIPQTLAYLDWTLPDITDNTALSELPHLLNQMQNDWEKHRNDPAWRTLAAKELKQWVNRILNLSGLLAS